MEMQTEREAFSNKVYRSHLLFLQLSNTNPFFLYEQAENVHFHAKKIADLAAK